jgi:hypothetical protein
MREEGRKACWGEKSWFERRGGGQKAAGGSLAVTGSAAVQHRHCVNDRLQDKLSTGMCVRTRGAAGEGQGLGGRRGRRGGQQVGVD